MIIKMNKFYIKNHNKLTNKRNKIKFNYKINNQIKMKHKLLMRYKSKIKVLMNLQSKKIMIIMNFLI